MKLKAILSCIVLVANGSFIRQKFIFDDNQEKKMIAAKSDYEKNLAKEAALDLKKKEEAEMKKRETDL